MHSENCFITLTYDDKFLPDDYSVQVPVFQRFMKRLREFAPRKLRFFGCGEYGDKELRPHYHALIFGYRFDDLKLHARNRGKPLYTSEKLTRLWPDGFSTVGEVNYQTAAYCARYAIKKIGGDMAAEHYLRIHPLTGKMVRVQPEFATQSRKPGLGATWFDKYASDAFPSDFIIVDKKKHPVPKFYALKLDEQQLVKIKRRRKALSLKQKEDTTKERLKVREEVMTSRLNQLKREVK